jgi:hypothetical protein
VKPALVLSLALALAACTVEHQALDSHDAAAPPDAGCPSTASCPDCPAGWVRLAADGCATCVCAPPSECETPGTDCAGGETCYAGAACADGCDAFTAGCCANTCSPSGCAGPAPVGCQVECPGELGCTLCAHSACTCGGDRWDCEAICVDELVVTCTYP